jgi:hypothetical protein
MTALVEQRCDPSGIARDPILCRKSENLQGSESQTLIAHFKRVYRRRLQGARVLRGDKKAPKIDVVLILADGADECVVFPPVSHGELSVLAKSFSPSR